MVGETETGPTSVTLLALSLNPSQGLPWGMLVETYLMGVVAFLDHDLSRTLGGLTRLKRSLAAPSDFFGALSGVALGGVDVFSLGSLRGEGGFFPRRREEGEPLCRLKYGWGDLLRFSSTVVASSLTSKGVVDLGIVAASLISKLSVDAFTGSSSCFGGESATGSGGFCHGTPCCSTIREGSSSMSSVLLTTLAGDGD